MSCFNFNATDVYVNGKLVTTPWKEPDMLDDAHHSFQKIDVIAVPYTNRLVVNEQFGHRECVRKRCSKTSDGSAPGLENASVVLRDVVDSSRTQVLALPQLRKADQKRAILIRMHNINNR